MDVFYEVPQEATADGFVLSQTREAAAQRARATQVAARLGLQLVGWAFAHPPRAHEVTVSELEQMAPMQKLLNSSQARPSMGAAQGEGGGWANTERVEQKVGRGRGRGRGRVAHMGSPSGAVGPRLAPWPTRSPHALTLQMRCYARSSTRSNL